jgi:hypothetical protein
MLNELKAIEERLWAEAEVRDATHGRDEWACVLLALASRYMQHSVDDVKDLQWKAPSAWITAARAGITAARAARRQ